MTSNVEPISNLLSLGNALVELGNTAIRSYKEVRELEIRYQAFLDALQHQREMVEFYLSKTFEERRFALENFFDRLDSAIESQDYQEMTVLVSGILGVLQQNPLYDFENFKRAMADPDFVVEL